MSRLWRNLLCIWVGAMFGGFGGLLVAIFWPLLFPLRLQGSSRGEDAVGIAFLAFYVSFAMAGFLLCRKLTRKYVREEDEGAGRVLFR
jgi:hypothetical protein